MGRLFSLHCVALLVAVAADSFALGDAIPAKRTVTTVEFYTQPRETDIFTGKRHAPTPLPAEVMKKLVSGLQKLDLSRGTKFDRLFRTSPDCRLQITFSDGTTGTFFLMHRKTLVGESFASSWDFPFGDELLTTIAAKK